MDSLLKRASSVQNKLGIGAWPVMFKRNVKVWQGRVDGLGTCSRAIKLPPMHSDSNIDPC